MKVVVAVKQVAEWDLFALQAALDLGDEVVAVTVGDDAADEVLIQCLARGVDRAVRVDPAGLAPDPLTTALLLAAFIGREAPDLVLFGTQSADAANGAVGTAVAGLLDMARVAVVRGLRLDEDGAGLELDRELEGGLVEQVSVSLPAVVTVQTGINDPRPPNLRALKRADAIPRELVSLSDLGLDASELERSAGARVRRVAEPSREGRATMLDGDAAEIGRRIWEIINPRIAA